LEKAHNLCFETKTSFQRDFEIKGRPDERDLFGGTIVRLGKQYGIGTEATRKIFDSIQKQKPLEKNKMKENL
jgi:2-dehydropantoate 2-reductase